jgi:adenylate cyclase
VGETLERKGHQLRITPQLHQVPTSRLLWSEPYPHRREDLLGLQQQLAADIAAEIRIKLMPADKARLAKESTENLEAWEACIRGRANMGIPTQAS